MLCNICHIKTASIHLEGIVNGKDLQLDLCEECALEKGIEFSLSKPHFSLVDLLAKLSDWEIPAHKTIKQVTCSACGLTYDKFKERGRLGCAKCYDTFKVQLEPLLKRIHGSTKHAGKNAKPETVIIQDEVADLRKELENAIKTEHFEKAAEIRDKIKAVKFKL